MKKVHVRVILTGLVCLALLVGAYALLGIGFAAIVAVGLFAVVAALLAGLVPWWENTRRPDAHHGYHPPR